MLRWLLRMIRAARRMLPFAARTPSIPQGLTEEQFTWLSEVVRESTIHLGHDVFIQGSRAQGRGPTSSDLDIAILVSSARFDEILRDRFGTPNPVSAKERTMRHASATGKIQAGEAGLRPLRQLLENELQIDVDISVIRRGSLFDAPPYMPLRGEASE
jgi:hypothetical protein